MNDMGVMHFANIGADLFGNCFVGVLLFSVTDVLVCKLGSSKFCALALLISHLDSVFP